MSDASQPTAKNYIRAFRARWFVLMSGPLTVPFAIAAIFVEGTWQKTGYAALAVFCGGYSSFQVWKAERLARNTAESELAQIQDSAPMITRVGIAPGNW